MKLWEEHVGDMVMSMTDLDGNVVAKVTKLHDTAGQARAWLEEIRWALVGAKQQAQEPSHRTTYGLRGHRSDD